MIIGSLTEDFPAAVGRLSTLHLEQVESIQGGQYVSYNSAKHAIQYTLELGERVEGATKTADRSSGVTKLIEVEHVIILECVKAMAFYEMVGTRQNGTLSYGVERVKFVDGVAQHLNTELNVELIRLIVLKVLWSDKTLGATNEMFDYIMKPKDNSYRVPLMASTGLGYEPILPAYFSGDTKLLFACLEQSNKISKSMFPEKPAPFSFTC